ncbi:unnamed protein product [Adineta ricciae]|uniref:Transmembrane 9 superfamily member n=1 Tax=Adineta ricciae TaxID=249248 RepID=A0A815LR72_ADIRI|nr:unnamed protein product [Adineta ricciae]
MTRDIVIFIFVILSLAINAVFSAPNIFCRSTITNSNCESELEVFVNRLVSMDTILSYEYSYFPFCKANNELLSFENLGQVLLHDRLYSSPYKFTFLKNEECHHVCTASSVTSNNQTSNMLERLMKGVTLNYQQNWFVDNIPVTLCYHNMDNEEYCSRGFPIGCYVNKNGQSRESCNIRDGKNDTFYIFNHLDFEITYHSGEGETWGVAFDADGGQIISIKVQVNSLNSDSCNRLADPVMFQSTSKDVTIPYTYSVKFVKNNEILWSNRWNYILKSITNSRIQSFSLINSLILILFLSVCIAVILKRILYQEIPHCYQTPDEIYIEKEMRWILIAGETWGAAFGEEGGQIISIKVQVNSLNSDSCDRLAAPVMFQSTSKDVTISYTYSVKFVKNNDILWSNRWNYILKSIPKSRIQWFSLISSLTVILFLSVCIAVTFKRVLHQEIPHFYQSTDETCIKKQMRWILVAGDVFRFPKNTMLLSVLIGNGIQITMMLFITLCFAYLGFLSLEKRGSFMTCLIICYILMNTLSGYTSACLYKLFNGKQQKMNNIMTTLVCPGFIFIILFILNFVLSINNTSIVIPFITFLELFALWFFISIPLVFIGAYFGYKYPIRMLENPTQTNQIQRQVPKKTLFTKPLIGIPIGGIFPFGCIIIQIYFLLSFIWIEQYYNSFSYLFVTYIILIITCSETTILLCYSHLCAEDYNWWWRSFFTSGFTAFYFFIYSICFFMNKLKFIDNISIFMYFGYTLILTLILFLFTGTIGFLACFWFVRRIYSAMKAGLKE